MILLEADRLTTYNPGPMNTTLALDGDTAVIATAPEDAQVFERDAGGPGVWGEVVKLTASDAMDDHGLGGELAISGDTIVASSSTMTVYVFERSQESGSQWDEVAKLTASDSPIHGFFGTSLGLTHGRLVVGDWRQEAWSGGAYVFERTNEGDWVEVSKLRLSNP